MKCFSYTDESGNSGQNLFDPAQETFWTGTVIAFADADKKYRSVHQELLTAVGATELHGAELGFGRIEKIAERLAVFIREKKLRFSFVRVHKPHLAAAKMFDLVFDSGNNPAVPSHAYGVKQLRLINLMHFEQLLTEEDLKEFWSLFQAQDAVRFGTLLETIRDRASVAPLDPRSLQILTEVLGWAREHPEAVLDPFGESDSPNFVAFTALFQHLHSFHKEEGHVIGCFVHDEQDQFVPSFTRAFEYLTKFDGKTGPMSIISDIEPIASFECSLEVRSSSSSFGLQLVDVCMWLLKRVIERGDKPRGACAKLFACLVERSWINEYDFRTLVRVVYEGAKYVEDLPLTPEALERGKAIVAQLEEMRRARMLEGDEGG